MTSEFEKMRKRILEQMDLDREISDGELYALIDREIAVYGKMVLLSLKEREEAQRWIFNSLRKLDVLQELLGTGGDNRNHGKWSGAYFLRKGGADLSMGQVFFHKGKAGKCSPADRGLIQQIGE